MILPVVYIIIHPRVPRLNTPSFVTKSPRMPIHFKENINVQKLSGVTHTRIEDVADELLPRRYQTANHHRPLQLSCDESRNLMIKKCKRRSQVDGLTYSFSQMPNESDNKCWKHVIRRPSNKNLKQKSAFVIECEEVDDVHIQYLSGDYSQSIRTAVEHCLESHTPVREIVGESGLMVGLGKHFERRSSTVEMYKPTSKDVTHLNPQKERDMINACFLSFDGILRQSVIKERYSQSIDSLESKGNIYKVNDSKLLPSYCCSESLTNSVHLDFNDSARSYSIFFPRKANVGQTWFVMPELSTALELKGCVVLSWDGRKVLHGSCSVNNGMLSLFGSAKVSVEQREVIKSLYNSKKRKLRVGDKVNVRQRCGDLKHSLDPELSLKWHQQRRFSNRKATVTKINGNMVSFIYEGVLKRHSVQTCLADHVVRK